jgi:hypothetical protein
MKRPIELPEARKSFKISVDTGASGEIYNYGVALPTG